MAADEFTLGSFAEVTHRPPNMPVMSPKLRRVLAQRALDFENLVAKFGTDIWALVGNPSPYAELLDAMFQMARANPELQDDYATAFKIAQPLMQIARIAGNSQSLEANIQELQQLEQSMTRTAVDQAI